MALGKKLNSLLENYFGETDYDSRQDQLIELELYKIQTSPFQPRTYFDDDSIAALAENIKNHGLLQPITVVEISPDVFQLISGERRLRAYRLLERETIPTIVKDIQKLNDTQQATLGIFENLHREGLSPMDTARAFKQLKSLHEWNNQELSKFLGCSRQHVENYLRLFDLSDYAQEALNNNKITEGHARLLHNLNADQQKKIVDEIIEKQLSIKATQRLIQKLHKVKKIKVLDSELRREATSFQSRFPKSKISFNGTRKKGTLIIKWSKEDEFPILN
ncbi:MAG: nucleoid occlusion protein [Patescibacteria group bacterium]